MAEAASLSLPYPEAAVVAEGSLREQTLTLASDLPERPLVLGGCCCAHMGAVEGLAARRGRIAVVWLDAHGDLNTPQTSPSGDEWGMPLRAVIDSGAVVADDVALVGTRNLDAEEKEFISASALHTGFDGAAAALAGTDGVYVAVDCDVLASDEIAVFKPEPGGLALREVEELLRSVRGRAKVLGAGFSGLVSKPTNVEPVTRLCAALGL
jgi:arginase